jgi:hypothetical protein
MLNFTYSPAVGKLLDAFDDEHHNLQILFSKIILAVTAGYQDSSLLPIWLELKTVATQIMDGNFEDSFTPMAVAIVYDMILSMQVKSPALEYMYTLTSEPEGSV